MMTLKEDELVAKLTGMTSGKWRAAEGEMIEGSEEEEEEEEPMSPISRLFHEPDFNCHIVYTVGIGTHVDVDVLKSGLQSTLLRHRRFSSIPVLDEKGKVARWVRTKVSIDDHTVIPDLDPTATSVSPDRLLEDYAYSLSCTPLDASRPLWDLHILNFPTSDAAAVLLFRIHHSLGDGISLTSLLFACSNKSTSDTSRRPRAPTPRLNPGRRPTILLWFRALLVFLWHTAVHVSLLIVTYLFLKDTSTPLKSVESAALRPKRFVHSVVSFVDIKDIKEAVNCTVNDVLIGVTSAAFTRYIDRKCGESTGDDIEKQQLPLNIRLRSTLIVNARPKEKLHASSEHMECRNGGYKWGNLISMWLMPFPIVKHEDPLSYIREGKAVADWKKKSLEAIFTYRSYLFFLKCFGMKVAAALCKRIHLATTFTFSNIVGPVEEIRFCGHPITYLAPSVYGHPHALTVHFQSYMNIMTIVIGVDESAISDPHQLLDDFTESLKLIKEAIPTKSFCTKGVVD